MLPSSVAEVGTEYAALVDKQVEDSLGLLDQVLRRGYRSPEAWRDAVQSIGDRLLASQVLIAAMADPYLNDVLDVQGADPSSEVQVDPVAFADMADGGGSWLQTLVFAPNSVRTVGVDWRPRFSFVAQTIVKGGLNDTGRSSVQSGMQGRPSCRYYVRMLVGKSCARCAILAGRKYKSSIAFRRHKRCFPAGVVVSGPSALASTRRWYEGELVVLATASGQELSLTGNHPVLTRRGWVPANLLQEGDEVVRSTRPQGATPLVVPDHHQVPALIEDVWRSLSMAGTERVPSSTKDFHGDGQEGEVDVVWADRPLGHRSDTSPAEPFRQLLLPGGGGPASEFSGERPPHLLDMRYAPHAGGEVGGLRLPSALLCGHLVGTDVSGIAGSASFDSQVGQPLGDHRSRHAVLGGETVFASPGKVGGSDGLHGEFLELARWDAPGDSFSMETREGYAALGSDLLDRLAGQVELDRVVQLRRTAWIGHVYSLTSSEGWHTANGFIVSNCDCKHIPGAEAIDDWTVDPKQYFLSLTAEEQVDRFGEAGAEAIRLGADMSQVVNAEKGVSTVTAYGREVLRTLEGTTRRGIAGQRLAAEGFEKQPANRYGFAMTPRLMPDEIFRQAELLGWDREEILRQLRRFAYVI